MAKRYKGGAEDRELRGCEEVTPPYGLTPFEDLQEAASGMSKDEETNTRRLTVIGSHGFPRLTLGTLIAVHYERRITLRCE